MKAQTLTLALILGSGFLVGSGATQSPTYGVLPAQPEAVLASTAARSGLQTFTTTVTRTVDAENGLCSNVESVEWAGLRAAAQSVARTTIEATVCSGAQYDGPALGVSNTCENIAGNSEQVKITLTVEQKFECP